MKALKPHECRNAWWHFESYVLSYLLPVWLFFWYLPNIIQYAYDKGRKVKIDMMHLKMLDILLLILIMCLVWSTCNKTAFLFYILLQFAKIAGHIFVFAYICKYSVFLRPSVYKIQCNFKNPPGNTAFAIGKNYHNIETGVLWYLTYCGNFG